MARIRTIKPEFFKNEQLADCEPFARLLFQGLWCLADRRGRLEDRPRRIKIEVFPYDDCDVDDLLHQLEHRGLIERYTVGDSSVIQIVTFEKHQRISGSEALTESELPENPKGNNGEATGKDLGSTKETPRTTGKERKGKEVNGGSVNPPSPVVVEVIGHYNAKTGREFTPDGGEAKELRGRADDGMTAQDGKLIVDHKLAEWGADQKMARHVVPSTLFRKQHHERYLADATAWDKAGRPKIERNGKPSQPTEVQSVRV